MNLPAFRYHPDPLATGVFETSDAICAVCARARGYVYALHVYATQSVGPVCPWCIADGTLARTRGATLVDELALVRAGLSQEIIEEVTERTPAYRCRQSTEWMICCGDACECHGDAPVDEIRALGDAALSAISEVSQFRIEDLREEATAYELGGSFGFYKFVCRKCARVHYNADCD